MSHMSTILHLLGFITKNYVVEFSTPATDTQKTYVCNQSA